MFRGLLQVSGSCCTHMPRVSRQYKATVDLDLDLDLQNAATELLSIGEGSNVTRRTELARCPRWLTVSYMPATCHDAIGSPRATGAVDVTLKQAPEDPPEEHHHSRCTSNVKP